MKRRNTASTEMVQDFKALKEQGVTHFLCTTWNGKKNLTPVIKCTAQGVSSYANSMYRKYGDCVSVEVGYFDNNFKWHTYCTYQA